MLERPLFDPKVFWDLREIVERSLPVTSSSLPSDSRGERRLHEATRPVGVAGAQLYSMMHMDGASEFGGSIREPAPAG